MEEENVNFENAMQELEQVADKLEKGNLSLEESVKEFEKGMELSKKCSDILEKAEKRISVLIDTADGMSEQEFIQNEE